LFVPVAHNLALTLMASNSGLFRLLMLVGSVTPGWGSPDRYKINTGSIFAARRIFARILSYIRRIRIGNCWRVDGEMRGKL
jgi:hypothetical protein